MEHNTENTTQQETNETTQQQLQQQDQVSTQQTEQEIQDEEKKKAGSSNTAGKTKKKRAGRRKIKIEFIQDKSRRHITFSKRKGGIMKKAYELSTLTGTQVLLLVASETGHVYTFATPKLQPLITKTEGKNLIQACLNAPDNPEQEQEEYNSDDEQRFQKMKSEIKTAPYGSQLPPPPTQHHQQHHQLGGSMQHHQHQQHQQQQVHQQLPIDVGNYGHSIGNLSNVLGGSSHGIPHQSRLQSQGFPGGLSSSSSYISGIGSMSSPYSRSYSQQQSPHLGLGLPGKLGQMSNMLGGNQQGLPLQHTLNQMSQNPLSMMQNPQTTQGHSQMSHQENKPSWS